MYPFKTFRLEFNEVVLDRDHFEKEYKMAEEARKRLDKANQTAVVQLEKTR